MLNINKCVRTTATENDNKALSLPNIVLRRAKPVDVAAVNGVIERAVMSWQLTERVKRRVLPLYRYNQWDFEELELIVAVNEGNHIIGVAAWEYAKPHDIPVGLEGLLLHALYVDPSYHRQGIGRRLVAAVEQAARVQQLAGILVKAQRDAVAFFLTTGWQPLSVDEERNYRYRFWKSSGPIPMLSESA